MVGEGNDSVMLDGLAQHRHVIQILDLLSESGCNTALLMRFVPARSGDLASALDLIAAHGLLVTDDHGRCDDPMTIPGVLRLTDRGEAVARALADRTVTTTEYNGDRLAGHRCSALGRTVAWVLNLRRHRVTGLPPMSRA
ncbi:hypothetical protein [Nocardia pseudobrasiliensis]|uniref:HxlR family transcriptional regulator n=1 Tax=Nocardia pseudobrasiliensis TaxID=45979 RepID=A0A370HPK8_9NOCA|nr:hypothetical protein [Nocardia pseudobrasiliensis]RDI60513.1 hypothetical protein DFR76_115143 [Nocardia pseudobrasiliensis]